MNRYKAMLAGVALLAVTTVSMAGILIGDFEGGLDGWSVDGVVITNDTSGVTLGTGSLQVTDSDGGWGANIWIPLLGQSNSTEMVTAATQPGAKVTMDVTAIGAENPGGWLQLGLYINADGYWGQPSWAGIALDGTTATIELPFDADSQTGIATGAGNASYANLGVMFNAPGDTTTYYVDNVQIIPEPATIGLSAFAGIGILFIRRRFMI